ncbi:uncharacterized protein METZ01_LOCUS334297, partial [marine metagenome]
MNKTIQKYFFIMLAAVLLHPLVLAQTTVTFTNAAATGRNGPTQAQVNTAYDGTTLDDDVTVSSGIQLWTVPATGTYTIEVWGAEGGGPPTNYTNNIPGKGARMKGDFSLDQGDVLKILVGQAGLRYTHDGTGGGGTFVALSNNTALIVAGGGGGSGYSGTYAVGMDAVTTTSGTAGSGYTNNTGGTNGNGGTATAWAGNGAGFTGNGGGSTSTGSPYAMSFINGGVGGNQGTNSMFGSFGGGGGTHGAGWGGGGGGGYSGGAGATSSQYGGGGGGSYNSSSTNTSSQAGVREGHGQVVITYCTGFCFESAAVVANNNYV